MEEMSERAAQLIADLILADAELRGHDSETGELDD